MKIKTNILKYKDPTTNGYVSIPVVAGGSGGSVDLSNYYTKEEIDNKLGGEVDVLPKADYTFAIADGVGMYMSEFDKYLVDGETYTVIWDNTEYNCIAKDVGGGCALGDLSIMDIGESTGEPFTIGIGDNEGVISCVIYAYDTSTTHNVRIYTQSTFVTKSEVVSIVDEIINEALNSEV